MSKTIAAISTPYGTGGIAIIRLSGDEAISISSKAFSSPEKIINAVSHTLTLGYINDYAGNHIDRAIVSVMRAPKTYTGEDIVEINVHGGILIAKRVLRRIIECGSSIAEPGEFTKRAFLNGKLDLAEAEAVIDTINAETELEQKQATGQLEGRLSLKINNIRQSLIHLLARMQVAIDYPDEDLEDITLDQINESLRENLSLINSLLSTANAGIILKDGIKTAIVGKPNVGKSSLLNRLCGTTRAIVTDIAGTTRDIVEQTCSFNGIKLKLLDTAGIHSTDDRVEQLGIELSKKAIEDAELVLVVLDASTKRSDEDDAVISAVGSKTHLLLLNKSDIASCDTYDSLRSHAEVRRRQIEDLETHAFDSTVFRISAKTGEGIDRVIEEIRALFDLNKIQATGGVIITNLRHKAALCKASTSLTNAINALQNGAPQDLITIDINDATNALGEITGASVSEDIVNEIFHKFCVGK